MKLVSDALISKPIKIVTKHRRPKAVMVAQPVIDMLWYVDEGWKYIALLIPGERLIILVDFDDYPGLFLYHCHHLKHEDMEMMRNYFVEG